MKGTFIEGFKDIFVISVIENKPNVRKANTFFIKECHTLHSNIATNCYLKKGILKCWVKNAKKKCIRKSCYSNFSSQESNFQFCL